MEKLTIILILICQNLLAQTQSDSLYVLKIDSLIELKNDQEYWGTDFTQKQIEDTTHYKTVLGRYKKGILLDLYYGDLYGGCERALFHLIDNELVLVEYKISDPDVYSEGPPSITYQVYFKDNQVVFLSTSNYLGGVHFCTSYDVNKKDFLSELSHCRQLLLNN
jgi:hypothetical protein